jgi:predicted dehydrogenase
MGSMSRRDFLHDSAAFGTALAGVGVFGSSLFAAEDEAKKKEDANDKLHVAVLGVNGRGMNHVEGFANKHNCVITTICDCDKGVIEKAMKAVEKAQKKAPKFEQDLRRVMDDKSIDIVAIATPNHWHALAAIWALQAGKHVYVEKPVSHNVSEGRRIVEAARKYNRICQTGTQSRSSEGIRQAMAFLHDGKLGKIHLARALCYKERKSIGKVKGPKDPPKTCDYDLWCGPAPKKPVMREKFHYDWHWQWDYGNGDLGNQGIHEMDKARWGLGKNELAHSVISIGGRFGYEDDGQTANTQICLYDYGDCKLLFEVRGLDTDALFEIRSSTGMGTRELLGTKVGNIFYGTEGYMIMPSYTKAVAYTNDGKVIKKFGGKEDHFGNFVKAVRSGKSESLNADILEGHLSSALCHLGNISYRLGTLQPFNKESKAFGEDKEAYETVARMEDHLQENGVPLNKTEYRVGRKLMVDPKTETFVNDKDADAMLTRDYREGFVVPAKL